MLRLTRYILALIMWLSFLFNIERLDLDLTNPDVFNIATPFYVLTVIIAVLGIMLPQWQRVPRWYMYIISVVAFIIGMLADDRPAWGGAYTYISLFELTMMFVTASLAYIVGWLTADFIVTVEGLLFSDMDGRVYKMAQAEPTIKREMQYSRRANRPLTVMVLDTATDNSPVDLPATSREIQQLLVKRHRLVALTRLLVRILRRTDFVLDQTSEGRLVLVMPEVRREQSTAIIDRLSHQIGRRVGLSLRWGIASFPEQGVTFEELLYQAERELQPDTIERRIEIGVEQHEGVTEKLPTVETITAQLSVDR